MAISLVWGLVISPENYQLQFHPERFFWLLVITLLIMPFQTTFEELFFRGYLSQGVAAATHSRWLTLIIISLAFGLMHAFNPEVKEYRTVHHAQRVCLTDRRPLPGRTN